MHKSIIVCQLFALILGQMANGQTLITVAKDGSGQFTSIQKAIDSFADDDAPKIVRIKPGIYEERVFIAKNNISLVGDSMPYGNKSWTELLDEHQLLPPTGVIIKMAIYRELHRCDHPDDWGAAVLNIRANDVKLKNLCVVNTYGFDLRESFTFACKEKTIHVKNDGHQFALRAMPPTQRLQVEGCNFYSLGGDTVSPWDAENGTYSFSNCTIEGGVDLYCPRGWAFAEGMHFICHNKNAAIWHDGSADSTAISVVQNSSFRGDPGFKLGRFHRDARIVLINCHFSADMADAEIYQVPTENRIKWGKRIYYNNCHRDGPSFLWFLDNIDPENSKNLTKEKVLSPRWNTPKPYESKVNHNILPQNAAPLVPHENFYCNPIIHADYSDPDAIRVADDYYMTASSFSHFPGLPILHSKDLVHWKIIGHAAPYYPDKAFQSPQHGNAIWAPSIRWHNGYFYIFFGDPDRGVFMTKAKDPEGPWAPLRLVKKVTGWIDCCPFWDDDGKAYLVHAYANSRVGLKSVLLLNEMSPVGDSIYGSSSLVFNGQAHHNTIEGPKMYKRNGYYYIFAPAGGVATGWQTVLRSKTVFGPYEDRIVLEQGFSAINGPHQGAWVSTAAGEDWFIHFQDKGAYGRIVHLQPVSWQNDWPLIGKDADGDGIGEPVACFRCPLPTAPSDPFCPAASDEFEDGHIGLQWQWQANPSASWYKCLPLEGRLQLNAVPKVRQANLWMQTNLLMQKFPAEAFEATAKLNLEGLAKGEEAGLIVFGLDYQRISMARTGKNTFSINMKTCMNADMGTAETSASATSVPFDARRSSDVVYLRLKVRSVYEQNLSQPKAHCQFSYSTDGEHFTDLGEAFFARQGKWVGAKMGLFCLAPKDEKRPGYVQIDWFRVR